MSQQNKADVSGNFTEDIEATIDDLFTPVKEIEIDPLTNEVKEKGMPRAAQQEAPSSSEASAEDGPVEGKASGKAEVEDSIDLELELDIDFEEQVSGESGDHEGHVGREAIEKFSENIMSLEWEIKHETIQTALDQANDIRAQGKGDAVLQELIVPMIAMLSGMLKEPDLIPAAPIALKKGAEALKGYMEQPENSEAVHSAAEEITSLLEETGRDAEEQPPEPAEEPELVLEPVEDGEVQGETDDVQEPETQVKEQDTDTDLEIELEIEEAVDSSLQAVSAAEDGQEKESSVVQSRDAEREPDEGPGAGEGLELVADEDVVGDRASSSEPSEEPHGQEHGAEKDKEGGHPAEQQLEVEPQHEVSPVQRDSVEGQEEPDSSEKILPEQQGLQSEPGLQVMSSDTAEEVTSEKLQAADDPVFKDQYEQLRMAVESHIQELDRLSAKMIPVEKLLAKTKGMAKLHTFQRAIRASIEGQRRHLDAVLNNRPLEREESQKQTQISEKSVSAVHVERSGEGGAARCPWNRLAVLGFGSVKIAFPVEEMAFAGGISGRYQKRLQKEAEFPMAWLKSWPWTKIAPSLSGPLASFSEKELKNMKFPIINAAVSEALGMEDGEEKIKNPRIIILFDGHGKGGVIYAGAEPEISEIDANAQWSPFMSDNAPVAGTLVMGDETITVISIK